MIDWKMFSTLARRTLLVACLPLALSAAVLAQARGGMPSGANGDDKVDEKPIVPVYVQMPEVPKVDRDLKQVTKLLSLATDQQAQVKDILTTRNQQIEDLIKQFNAAEKKYEGDQKSHPAAGSNQSGDISDARFDQQAMAQSRAALKNIRNDTKTKIAALLTDSQMTTYNNWNASHAKSEAADEAGDFQINKSPKVDDFAPGGGGRGGRGGSGGGPEF